MTESHQERGCPEPDANCHNMEAIILNTMREEGAISAREKVWGGGGWSNVENGQQESREMGEQEQ